jgi:cation transport regulator ChaB
VGKGVRDQIEAGLHSHYVSGETWEAYDKEDRLGHRTSETTAKWLASSAFRKRKGRASIAKLVLAITCITFEVKLSLLQAMEAYRAVRRREFHIF